LFFKNFIKKGDEMKKLSVGIIIFLMLLNISGCAPLIFVAAGGVGVYAISKDTVQGDSDTPYESIWDAAIRVSKIRGTVKKEDYNRGVIEADANPNRIWIRFERLTPSTTRIKISARKYHFPNINLAQELFIKILEEARQQ
jgi:hypothetical protein